MKVRQGTPVLAFAVAALGIAVFSVMDAVMKGLVIALGIYTVMLWRSLAGLVLSGAIYAAVRPSPPSRAAIRVHVIRGAISAAMAITFFWGLARVPMAQAIALAFIAPLASLFLSTVMLGERIGRRAAGASCLALVGVGVILFGQWRNDLGPEAFRGAVAVLVSAVCYAFNIVLMRQQALVAGPVEVAFSQSLVVTVVLAVGAPLFAGMPDAGHWPPIIFAAALAVTSLLLLAWAYARAPASYLAPTEYTSFLWAAFFGFTIYGEHLSPFTLAGALLIVAGCVLAARARPIPEEAFT